MLQTKHQIGSAPQNPTQSLLALKPRQVLLAHKNTATTNTINTTGMTMSKQGSTIRTLNLDQKALLLHSILCYLDRNGFSKPLKRLISDAQIQDESWKTCSFNLEDMFLHYLETCTNTDAKPDTSKEQELNDTKKLGHLHSSVVEEAVVKKKKSKGDENDSVTAVADNGRADSDVELKPKKKSKKPSDSAQETEQISDRATKEQKDKKKKSKHNSVTLESNVQHVQLDSSQVEQEVKSKDKKKKSKLSGDSVVENIEHSEKVELVSPSSKGDGEADTDVEGKSKDKKKKKKKHSEKIEIVAPSSKGDGEAHTDAEGKLKDKKKNQDSDLVVENTNISQQGETGLPKDNSKKKKVDLTSEMLSGDIKVPNKKGIMENNPEEGPVLTAKDGIENEKKDSKKRKRSLSDENGADMSHTNGNYEKNGEETAARKSRRKEVNGSAEPKTVNPFQRVKIDEVEFADERLQNNSYWAKGGAEIGYGAKAQEILGQVRGRDFRHEKTKKKRGSYRGGQIDLQTHSVKFNYSDED